MQIFVKNTYAMLFAKKYPNANSFLSDVINDEDHPMWGPGGAAREYARESLKSKAWYWLGKRVDDFALLVEISMRKKLVKWKKRAEEQGKGALANKKLCSNTYELTLWLAKRFTSLLKNLFDCRYKDHLDIKRVYLVSLHENHITAGTDIWKERDSTEESIFGIRHIAGSKL